METAASIIAFVQITSDIVKCMIKAKQIWDQSKDLPEDIQDLIIRLQQYKPIFEDMENQLTNDADGYFSISRNDSLVLSSLKISNQAHQTLEALVTDLKTQLNTKKGLKRKLAAIRMVMGKDNVERLKTRLSSAIELLEASVRAYQIAFTRQAPDFIVQKITKELCARFEVPKLEKKPSLKVIQGANDDDLKKPAESKKPDDNDTTKGAQLMLPTTSQPPARARTFLPSKTGRFYLSYVTGTGAWQACVQWPSWLSQGVFEIQSNPTLWSSSYSFRTYNIVSFDSDIVQRVRNGDKNGVLELFRNRQASPFDKDQNGSSLLYHAVYNGNYEMCRLLLNNGLQETLVETVGQDKESPLSALVYQSEKKQHKQPEQVWQQITELFHSYLDDPESTMILRLFDFIQEWAHGDEYVLVFQKRFLKKFYTGPLLNRLEAFRLGSFHLKTPRALMQLIAEDRQVTSLDVEQSSQGKLSLVHSVAVALGIRFADEVLPYKRGWCQWRVYNDGWSDAVRTVASVATPDDLHEVETVSPWDAYHVPSWRGTPLVSVLGGALCYVSPDITFFHWDAVFQGTIRQWAQDLHEAGVDLVEYGKREALTLKEQLRGALDADAIESSRHQVKNPMAGSAESLRVGLCKQGKWNQNHWVPIRLLSLEFGPRVSDWRIVWAPEFEWMASQFWEMVERRETSAMPGSWID